MATIQPRTTKSCINTYRILSDYRRIADRTFLPRLREMSLDMITRQDVIGFIAWCVKQPNQR